MENTDDIMHGKIVDPRVCGTYKEEPAAQHSATPWKLDGNWIVSGWFGIHELPAGNEGSQPEHLANRDYIVLAVNAHQASRNMRNEALHYANTGKGKEFLLKAIAEFDAIAQAEGK